jgi:anti-sigma factor RsiW
MNCERILEIIPKAADGEALDWEREALAEHLAGCPDCSAVQAELAQIGMLVRRPVAQAVAEADFSALWRGISHGIDRAESQPVAKAARASGFGRLLPRLSYFGAAAAIASFALFTPAPQAVAVADNHVDVQSVEAGANQTVTVYTNPDDDVTFIWVDEDA